jgi:arylsulfatase A-like enzyme
MAQTQRPNVVFIISDDTRPAWLGCYGGNVPTPNVDTVASRGVRFDEFFCSSSVCQPSRYSYLTGRYAGTNPDPLFAEVNPTDRPARIEFNTYLNDSIPSQGWFFKTAGYRTGFAGKWHVGYPSARLGIPQIDPNADLDDPATDTFLRQREATLSRHIRETAGFDYAAGIIWCNNGERPIRALHDHHIEWSVQKALDFLDDQSTDQPFLLHYASTCVHGPNPLHGLDRDPRYTPGWKIDHLCDALPPRTALPGRLERLGLPVNGDTVSVLWYDDQVGAIVRKLEERGLAENTIIVVCTDHGVEPAKATCYERGIRVPCIVAAPEGMPRGEVVSAHAQNIDMMPTLLELCRIDDGGVPFDGTSLVPLMRGQAESVHDDLYVEVGYLRAVRTPEWKYISLRYPNQVIDRLKAGVYDEAPNHMHATMGDRQVHAQIALCAYPGYFDPDELYDLRADPFEQHNLADDPAYAEVLAEMKRRLRAHLDRMPHPYPLDDQVDFLGSPEFQELARKTRAFGVDHISWWSPDRVAFD